MSQKHNPIHEQEEQYPKKGGAGRGFFTVLALCLIAVGGVAAATFSDSFEEPPATNEATSATVITTAPTTAVEPVAVPTATTTVTTIEATATTATTQAQSLFVLPLSNTVLTPFSEQPVYNETMANYSAHKAVDFDGEEGQRVRPLAAGTVSAVETDALWGGCITIDHSEGVISVYRGVEAQVEVGAEVTVEDFIGIVDAVPCESKLGPHLHLELYKDGDAVDPCTLLTGQLTSE